ncbi:MAG: S26 family signal peptidase [Phycisphaerales bacterium]
MADTRARPADKETGKFSIRETFSSIIIAFAMAFIFRAFVIEAFVIPTGSMAPTLLGQHVEIVSDQTGARWQVGPWTDGNQAVSRYTVHDPMTASNPPALVDQGVSAARSQAYQIDTEVERLRAGDRILVLKYLPLLFEPKRFDVVVFKNPTEPTVNYIKRLTGLPGEQLAIVDGDVFTRPLPERNGVLVAPGDEDLDQPGGTWAMDGWSIARKPEHAQRAVWMTVHDTARAPVAPIRDGYDWYNPPWVPVSPEGRALPGWEGLDTPTPEHTLPGTTRLEWNTEAWPIVDYYPYNERYRRAGDTLRPLVPPTFGVGDIRIRMGVEPVDQSLERLAIRIDAREHAFRALLVDGTARIEMRPLEADDSAWELLDEAQVRQLPAGQVTDVEFWHVDQALWLFVGGKRVAYATYDWGPMERFELATNQPLDARAPIVPPPSAYRSARPAIALVGPVKLHRLGLDRDLYYQTTRGDSQLPVRGSHPALDLAVLDQGQFFVCGDNSASSQDSRLLGAPSPWVSPLGAPAGIVPSELMLGRAFFVYFPAVERAGPVPVPGFGRLRFIW